MVKPARSPDVDLVSSQTRIVAGDSLAGEAAGNVCPGFVHPGSATTRIRPLEGLKREYSDATHS